MTTNQKKDSKFGDSQPEEGQIWADKNCQCNDVLTADEVRDIVKDVLERCSIDRNGDIQVI